MIVQKLLDQLDGCNPTDELIVSVDVSTCENDCDARVFGDILHIQENGATVSIICEES